MIQLVCKKNQADSPGCFFAMLNNPKLVSLAVSVLQLHDDITIFAQIPDFFMIGTIVNYYGFIFTIARATGPGTNCVT